MMGDRLPEGGFSPLVPELDVHDLAASLVFWRGLLGFSVAYSRLENGFAYLERDGAQVMLNVVNGNWRTGALEPPLGRGINLQIAIDAVDPILAALDTASWPLFRPAHEAWYRVGEMEVGVRQFLVQDPDGYLLRFAENLGRRPLNPGGQA
ncbi:VOC family protein [Methylobacterium sp. 10]|uniref:bleomycin resistance protein n=1 Tax=Methylobacterium sp. 10 TaxID=1101191 RepID=UPI0009E09159|nr:VOC family protein [Methylobacterium sp. 10]